MPVEMMSGLPVAAVCFKMSSSVKHADAAIRQHKGLGDGDILFGRRQQAALSTSHRVFLDHGN
jgi:hypothetical protein